MNAPRFDASSDPPPAAGARQSPPPSPFLGIQFRCCRRYGRVYRNRDQTRYEGRCPGCGRLLSVPIGLGGTPRRFFTAE